MQRNRGDVAFDPDTMLLTEIRGSEVRQWSLEPGGLQERESWSITALEVTPLVRRVIVDRQGTVARASLTINITATRGQPICGSR